MSQRPAQTGAGRPIPSFRLRALGVPSGFDVQTWARLLRENDQRIDAVYGPKVALVTMQAVYNSLAGALERRRYGDQVATAEIQPPLFIIGHWRSGTTFLHQLLACDEQFAYPNAYQCWHPHGFLLDEPRVAPVAQRFFPRTRLIDRVPFSVTSPQEEEWAMMFLSGMSPMTGWVFPQNAARYDRWLTLRSLTCRERQAWSMAHVGFLKKLSWRYQKPLILKSPAHTARIRTLLELFPDARFIHIHRDPYEIFQSTRHMLTVLGQILRVQRADPSDDDARILHTYVDLYDAFFDDRSLIPERRFTEIRFKDLERDPLGTIEQTYDSLGLSGFCELAPRLREHVASLGVHRKNEQPPLSNALRGSIAAEWRRSFDAWGYAH